MSDLPILFSAPMVRALLAGTKTQTRRVIKPQPYGRISMLTSFNHGRMEIAFGPDMKAKDGGPKWWRPLAQAGDRLWVREAWRTHAHYDDLGPSMMGGEEPIRYEADGAHQTWGYPAISNIGRHRVGMHMPRWASRLTLYVTDVRVERLQDISEEDAVAEGVPAFMSSPSNIPAMHFQSIWESINGPGSWEANPWVWVVSFKRITP